jgi:membrane fusion protein, multidrug efflux system
MSNPAQAITMPESQVVSNRPQAKLALAPKAEAPQPAEIKAPPADKPKRPSVIKRLVLGAMLVAAIAAGAKYGYDWYVLGRFQISTNDAYVQTDMSQLGAKVSGYVTEIPAAENTAVKVGDIVLKLDDGDYKLAVDAAKAKIETQKAVIERFKSLGAAQSAEVAAAQAKLKSAQASVSNATATEKRASELVNRKIGSQQTLDNATLQLGTANAAVTEAQAGIASAEAQIDVIAANKVEAQRLLSELETALAKAERDMSFTEIRAPFNGIVANRAVQPGQFVQAGTRLMALVPDDASFIEANFKETQLADIHPGQKVLITVDAINGESYEGKVLNISPASGAEFSLLPPENATGNFTKITQRVPVKVAVSADLAAKLRAGLSVTVTVDTRDKGAS